MFNWAPTFWLASCQSTRRPCGVSPRMFSQDHPSSLGLPSRSDTWSTGCSLVTGPSTLKGYKRNTFRTSAAQAHVAWKWEELVSRVLTVLGTTGFVLGAVTIKDEATSTITDTLTQLAETIRLHVSVDFATMELHHSLSARVPTFPCPMRGSSAFDDEVQANGNHASPVSWRSLACRTRAGRHTVPVAAFGRHHRIPS